MMRLLPSSSSIQRLGVPLSSFRVLSSSAARTPTTTPDADVPGRRRQFKQIPVDPKLLQYILEQQICKKVRQKKARKLDRFIGDATRTPAQWVEQQRQFKQEQQQRARRPANPPARGSTATSTPTRQVSQQRQFKRDQRGRVVRRPSSPQTRGSTANNTTPTTWQIQQQRRGTSPARQSTSTTWQPLKLDPRRGSPFQTRGGNTATTTTATTWQPKPQGPPLPFGPRANPVRVRQRIQASDNDISGMLDQVVPYKIPVVALCGRSNVGML